MRNKSHTAAQTPPFIQIRERERAERPLPLSSSSCPNMGALQLTSSGLSSTTLLPTLNHNTRKSFLQSPNQLSLPRRRLEISGAASETAAAEETPTIDFAFVSSVLLPDGTPDVQIRSASGGQKLRDIMLDCHIDLYGPYERPLLNCAGGGTCETCMVEVVEGKELLSPRTDREKEALKKKPRSWRLACQTMVGKHDSRGQVVIQQLPEWKAHEWH